MSLYSDLMSRKDVGIKFIIPAAGKMFNSTMVNGDKALCFCINKGYLQTTSFSLLSQLNSHLSTVSSIKLVDSINKIRLKNGSIVYRQRIFFKSLSDIAEICKIYCIKVMLSTDFRITINCVTNCAKDLAYLERYAFRYNESIETWLTNACKLELFLFLRRRELDTSGVDNSLYKLMQKHQGYLVRAPFLIDHYSIDEKTSGIFISTSDLDNIYLYDDTCKVVKGVPTFGFTQKVIKQDKRKGYLYGIKPVQ